MIYNLKIIKCGNRVEIYKYTNFIVKKQGKEEDFYKFIEEDPKEIQMELEINPGEKKEVYRINNLNKSRNKIVRLIKCNPDMKTFITLTFKTETDYKRSKKYLNNLFNKLRRDIKGFKYIWVLEYGEKNNRLHYHLLCNYPIDIKLCSSKDKKSKEHKKLENYFKNRYWNNLGFIDIRALNQEGNSNIALYVSSYIVKSLGNKDLEGYRVFGYSNKTLNKPEEIKLLDHRSIEEILKDYQNYKCTYNNSYDIGYIKDGKENKGKVTYFDFMEVKKYEM